MVNRGIFVKCIFSLLRPLLIAFTCTFLQGCIGIGFSITGDHSTPVNIPVLTGKHFLSHHQGEPLSADYVVSQWGEPNHRKQIDGGEIWEYHGEHLRWHGVSLALLLPLPLLIPFGHEYVTLVIQDRHVQSAVQTYSGTKFEFFCGYTIFTGGRICRRIRPN